MVAPNENSDEFESLPVGKVSIKLYIFGKSQVETSVLFKVEHFELVIGLLRVEDSVFLDIINSVVS